MKFQKPLLLLCFVFCLPTANAAEPDTLPPLNEGAAPETLDAMWAGFDPRSEPLETELLHEWEEDDVVLRVIRFRVGVFKGQTATLAAIYGFPKTLPAEKKLPGLVQIHGGGQYADAKACLTNAKRGYATVSIAWAGRISSTKYRVSPDEVKLFWANQVNDPNYRLTTDWGAVDGYHAPGRNPGNQFPSIEPAAWTLDDVESPRNSGWFLCAMAARRALTFLEQQPEVDATRLGVYGHSMGGKLTVLTSVDPRVQAAAPSCGGISDRDNRSPLFRKTLGDGVSLKRIQCPICFLSPANDFHGRIGDLPTAIDELRSEQWRITCSPHHNHQDTAPYEVATQLWMDQHLKGTFEFPTTPETKLDLNGPSASPVFTVTPDASMPVQSVDIFYTSQGKADERPEDRLQTMHRFWHHAEASENGNVWSADLPLETVDAPLWVYANVRYQLNEPVTGAGYYYGIYTTDSFNLSSLLTIATADELQRANVGVQLEPQTMIEDFADGWQKEWFIYSNGPEAWQRRTNKLSSRIYQPPPDAMLSLEVHSDEANTLVIRLDDVATEVSLSGGGWKMISLQPSDFKSASGESVTSWRGLKQLTLSDVERLRRGRGEPSLKLGKRWEGKAPEFRNLQWTRKAE
ncbi:MAG: dienelactone hydrolase family protein [Planctomycetota bacterium]